MGYYEYRARDVCGETHKGIIDATSEQDAARKLKSGKLYPVSIKSVRRRRPRRVPEDHIIRFFFDLSDLLLAGLPVDRALALISANQTHKVFQRVVKELLEDVQGGSDLSSAIGKFRDIFGELTDHMVRAGEAGGSLGPILKRLAGYLERRREFRQSLVSAMIYPSVLLSTSLVSMIVLLMYVIPKFADIFRDLNQKVPFLTEVMLDVGVFLKEYGWLAPILLGVAFFGGRYLLAAPAVRNGLDRVLLRLPLSRTIILHTELTRFCRTLGTMIQSGVPLLRSLDLGRELVINTALKEAVGALHGEIKVGRSMSDYFRAKPPFPPRMGTMLRIAEERGNLGDGLVGLGEYFEKELQRLLQRLMSLAEPLVIILTGGVIGLMVLSMFTAIFSINDIKF